MIVEEIIPVVGDVAGLDLDAYADAVLDRFRNPAIVHRLDQIAQDGSQKLPYRLGDTLLAHRRAGRVPTHILAAYGAWITFVRKRAAAGIPVIDPLADKLFALVGRECAEGRRRRARAGWHRYPGGTGRRRGGDRRHRSSHRRDWQAENLYDNANAACL